MVFKSFRVWVFQGLGFGGCRVLRVFRVGALGISGFSGFRVGCFWCLFVWV